MKYLQLLIILLLLTNCHSASNKSSIEKLEDEADNASKSGDYERSIYYYNQLIKIDTLKGEYYFARACAKTIAMKDDSVVLKDFFKALHLNYQKGSCYYNIGLLTSYSNDSLAAIYFKKAIEIYPNRHDIQKEYTECLERLKNNSPH